MNVWVLKWSHDSRPREEKQTYSSLPGCTGELTRVWSSWGGWGISPWSKKIWRLKKASLHIWIIQWSLSHSHLDWPTWDVLQFHCGWCWDGGTKVHFSFFLVKSTYHLSRISPDALNRTQMLELSSSVRISNFETENERERKRSSHTHYSRD